MLAGPVEATVIGNIVVQAIAAGQFGSLAEARHHVAANFPSTRFDPTPFGPIVHPAASYHEIEARLWDH